MTIKEFAERHHLKVVSEQKAVRLCQVLDGKPKCDVEHAPGRRGWIRADKGCYRVAVMGMTNIGPIISRMKEMGLDGVGRGDREVMRYFDPENEAQAHYALEAIKARRKRQVSAPSAAQLEVWANFAKRSRGVS